MDHTKFQEPKEEAIKEELSAQLSTLNIEGNEENDEQVSSDQLENSVKDEVKEEDTAQDSPDQSTENDSLESDAEEQDTAQAPSNQSLENELFELAKKICDKLKLNTEMQEDGSRSIAASIQLLKSAHDSIQKEEDMKNNKKNQIASCQGVSPKTLYQQANGNMRILYIQLSDGYTKEARKVLRAATHKPLKTIGWNSDHKATSYLYYTHRRGEESDESLREGVQQVLNTLLYKSLGEDTNLSRLLIKAIPNGDFSFYISQPALISTNFMTQPTMGYRKDKITCTLHILFYNRNTILSLEGKLTERGWISRANLKTVYSKEWAANTTNENIESEVGTIIKENEIEVVFFIMKPKYVDIEGRKTLVTFEQICFKEITSS